MPLTDPSGRWTLAFNGEIYNFRQLRTDLVGSWEFRTGTDTEVLLAYLIANFENLPAGLSNLHGMFAFALWDAHAEVLLLARDKMGIKPLHLMDLPSGGVAFASERRALASLVGRRSREHISQETLAMCLLSGHIPADGELIHGLRALPPGSMAVASAAGVKHLQWWSPAFTPEARSDGEWADRLHTAVTAAVGRQMVADRPLGVFLSGGVDSRILAKVASQHARVQAITLALDGHGQLDESARAGAAAVKFGLPHEVVHLAEADILPAAERALAAIDQPSVDGFNTSLVCSAARASGLVVALSGVGGDELLGGYGLLRRVPRLRALGRYSALLPGRRLVADEIAKRRPASRAARALAVGPTLPAAYRAARDVFTIPDLRPTGLVGRTLYAEDDAFYRGDTRDKVSFLDLTRYMTPRLLNDTDAVSMAEGLEVRVPLLDDYVWEVASAMPPEIRHRGKILLAEAFREEAAAQKQGFVLPMDSWMRGPLRPLLREGLLSADLPFHRAIPQDFRKRLLSAHESRHIHWSRAWLVAVTRLWPDRNGFH